MIAFILPSSSRDIQSSIADRQKALIVELEDEVSGWIGAG